MQRKREGRKPKSKRRIVRLIPVYRTTWSLFCPECGGHFQASRRDALTCSTRCRSRRFRRVQKERAYLHKMQETEPLFDTPLNLEPDEPLTFARMLSNAFPGEL